MDDRRPELIIVAGPNGSGKTSLTEQLLHAKWIGDDMAYINPDIIANERFGGWNNPDAILKAAQEADRLRHELIESRQSLAFETVFSSDQKLQFALEAAEAGYFIRLFFVSTSGPEINASRITRRVLAGGHAVPIDKIIKRYTKSIANCEALAPHVDRLYVYDNSYDNQEPALLFRGQEGRIKRLYDRNVPEWAAGIFQGLAAPDHDASLTP